VFILMLVYVVFVIIRPQEYMAALAEISIMPLLLVGAFGLWLLHRGKPFWAPQFALILAFLLAIALSMVASGWSGGAVDRLNVFGPEVIAFLVLATATTTPRRVTLMMTTLVLCSAVLAVHGLLQARDGIGWTGTPLTADGRIQYLGFFNDPNDLGLLFVSTLPMALHLRKRAPWPLSWMFAICAGLFVYGVYLTNSRGGLLAVLAIAGLYAWQRFGVIAAASAGAVGLAVMMALPSRLQELDVGESSALGRVDAWYEGLQMFLANPLFGVGMNNFTEYHYLTAHNSFILVLAETGFVGYTIWFAFFGYCFRMLWTIYSRRPLAESPARTPGVSVERVELTRDRAIAGALLLSLAGFFAAAFFLSRSYVLLLYLLAALAVGHYVGHVRRIEQPPPAVRSGDWLRWPLLALASVVFFFVMVRVLLGLA
jgi:O-antigen ligase